MAKKFHEGAKKIYVKMQRKKFEPLIFATFHEKKALFIFTLSPA